MHQRVIARSLARSRRSGPENNSITNMRQLQRQLFVTGPGYIAWLGAIAVVLLQLQLATHHGLDHDVVTEADESCEVCLKLDASGKVPTLAQPVIPVPQSQSAPTVSDQDTPLLARTWTRPARAPPQA